MPADPEALLALQAVGNEIKASVDATVGEMRREAEASRERLYNRLDQLDTRMHEKVAEVRGAVQSVSLQVVAISTELHAHTAHADSQFRRIDDQLRSQSTDDKSAMADRGKLWSVIAYLLGALGLTSLGSSIVDKLKGGGQ